MRGEAPSSVKDKGRSSKERSITIEQNEIKESRSGPKDDEVKQYERDEPLSGPES